MNDCNHPRLRPQVYDQTLGVWCPDCSLQEWCWSERHVSEALWNLACRNDPMANRCAQSRPSHCAMCDERTDTHVD